MIKFLKILSYVLVAIGALNWGLVGALNFNLVTYLFGEMTMVSRIIYCLVGFCGLLLIVFAPQCCSSRDD